MKVLNDARLKDLMVKKKKKKEDENIICVMPS